MPHQFTAEEIQQFNYYCLVEWELPLEIVRDLVRSAIKLKKRNRKSYIERKQKRISPSESPTK